MEHQSHQGLDEAGGIGLRQWVKVVVYTLLLANFAFYIYDDWQIARYTLNEHSTFLDWTSAFAASIDELAWFVLLFLFELETYVLDDESFTRARVALMHVTRLACYVILAHTLFAYATVCVDLGKAKPADNVSSLCDVVGTEVSFGYNLDYSEIDTGNCATLSSASEFHLIDEGLVITDAQGLAIEKQLAWLDLAEATVWLLILFSIEAVLRLQEKGITRSTVISTLKTGKIALYGFLWFAAAYWIYRGHFVYAWDEALWILGFMAIDMNLSEWKKEIEGEQRASDL